ncbi:MAG: hypothetical protein PHN74_02770 [Candidatus Pacebacteria bacterium]|nr:hypothetical protein [Candidatus Paceibacterota bacterium]
MNLKTFKISLPKTWQETSRMGGESQVNIRVSHINPLSKIDEKRFQDQVTYKGDVSTTRLAVQTTARGMRPMKESYNMMKNLITQGIMPPDMMNMGKLDEMWKGLTEVSGGERTGDSDVANDIDIIQYPDEETAWQALKNKGLMQTQGLDVPMPGNITIPGMPKNMTMSDLFQSDLMKNFIPKDKLGYFSKMQLVIKGAQQQMPGIKQNLEKKGVKYGEGKYLGCKTVYMTSPNQTPPPEAQSASSSKADNLGLGMGGKGVDAFEKRGGHIAHLDPLPKFKEPYSATNTMYLGILYKNFVINGSLLWGIAQMPSGDTPCYSLNQTKELTTTEVIDGKSFTGTVIVPLPSTFAKEGYLNKEEVEKIYKDIISKLK